MKATTSADDDRRPTASAPPGVSNVGPAAPPAPADECWRRIGVTGDRSCPELESYIHCRNCPVMAAAARTFFDRAAPEGYLEGWRGILEESAGPVEARLESLLVFRLGQEWHALPTCTLVEVTTRRTCHRVPHRTGGVLEGIVNIRGQLQLCVSAHRLLGIEEAPTAARGGDGTDEARFLVVERPGQAGADRWVFRVDAVAGVHRVDRARLRAVPDTVSQSGARYCRSLFDWGDSVVGILDDARLFEGLADSVHAT
jgi:chemotaxis-related protein WspD